MNPVEEPTCMEIDEDPPVQGLEETEPTPNDQHEQLRMIAVLIDELSQEDMQVRASALKQVTTIAQALGPERTREELIPYLTDMLEDDDDVLRIICEVLLQLTEFIGGVEHYWVLINPYETLCVVEELTIRNLAIEKLSAIIKMIPQHQVLEHLPPIFNRLSSSTWHTARSAAAGIAHHMYPRLQGTDACVELQNKLIGLAKDKLPQVRRAVAENLAAFAVQMDPELVEQSIFQPLVKLANDEQDSVRVRALQSMIQLSHIITAPANARKLRWTIRHLCSDPSWRVRFLAAREFHEICQRLETVEASMLDIFLKLLKDTEAEVRAAASSQLPELSASFISESVMNDRFVSTFRDLSDDENKFTRAQFAEVVVLTGSRYSQEFVVQNILPLVLKLLEDPEPEPRLKCLSHLDLDVVNALDLLESIMPCITKLATDGSWRIRQSVMGMLPNLCARLGPQMVDAKIKELMFQLMADKVQAVRAVAAETMLDICQRLDNQAWSEQTLKEIFDKAKVSNYLHRQTAMEAITGLMDALQARVCLETLLSFAEDPVPNVRFKLCRTISELISARKIPPELIPIVIEKITPMTQDSDADVVYFAEAAVVACNNLVETVGMP